MKGMSTNMDDLVTGFWRPKTNVLKLCIVYFIQSPYSIYLKDVICVSSGVKLF
jgi:hypothetical protein